MITTINTNLCNHWYHHIDASNMSWPPVRGMINCFCSALKRSTFGSPHVFDVVNVRGELSVRLVFFMLTVIDHLPPEWNLLLSYVSDPAFSVSVLLPFYDILKYLVLYKMWGHTEFGWRTYLFSSILGKEHKAQDLIWLFPSFTQGRHINCQVFLKRNL